MTSAPDAPDAPRDAPAAGASEDRRRSARTGAPGPALRDPHRHVSRGPRLREKIVLVGYLVGEWFLGLLPLRPAARVGGWAAVGAYWLWPQKRRVVTANCARVLDLPPADRRVGALARAVYRNQVRWVLELMHMHRLSRAELVRLVDPAVSEPFDRAWRESNGLIVVAAHYGNNEAGAAGLAGMGWPMHAVAEDTAYHDLYRHFEQERARWGVKLIPWRNLRGVFRVLRSKEILALLVDWGYRPDGVPVRFFGEWTTFPAGPAVLAAKTGATIVPVRIARGADGIHRVSLGDRIRVMSTARPELQRATQLVADALERGIREEPEQWCVFKPMWPHSPAEQAELRRRIETGDIAGDAGGSVADAGPGAADAAASAAG